MRVTIRPVVVALGLACFSLAAPVAGPAAAQDNQAQQGPKQMALTDKQVEAYLSAKPDIDAVVDKLPQDGNPPDQKTMAKLDGLAKKHGYASFADYDAVSGNISIVMDGFDPETKQYIGSEAVLKKEIAGVQADKKMPANDKKEMLAQLNDSLKSVTPLQFPDNAKVVGKYYDKLSESMSGNQ